MLPPLGVFVVALVLWHVAASSVPANLRSMFPTPLDAGRGLLELSRDGRLAEDIGASLARFAVGYLAAIVAGMPTGILLGRSSLARRAFDPLLQVLRPISPIAWFPLFSLWFGIGELPAIVIIFIAAVYPVALTTAAAVRGVDPIYIKVARNFGESRLATLWRVVIPAALPGIVVGLRVAMGASWVFLVAGEMLGVQSGLGFLVIDARNSLRTDLVMVVILVIGILGLTIDRVIAAGEKAVVRAWGGGSGG